MLLPILGKELNLTHEISDRPMFMSLSQFLFS